MVQVRMIDTVVQSQSTIHYGHIQAMEGIHHTDRFMTGMYGLGWAFHVTSNVHKSDDVVHSTVVYFARRELYIVRNTGALSSWNFLLWLYLYYIMLVSNYSEEANHE